MLRVVVAACALLSLTACAGRAPQISPLTLASDPQLSCGEIDAETKLNRDRITALASEQSWKLGQNAVAGVAGFMVWPAWLALDFQNAAGQEAQALSQRNEYLLALTRERCSKPTTQEAKLAPAPPPEFPSALASNAEIEASLMSR
jgi:hypothetical protein